MHHADRITTPRRLAALTLAALTLAAATSALPRSARAQTATSAPGPIVAEAVAGPTRTPTTTPTTPPPPAERIVLRTGQARAPAAPGHLDETPHELRTPGPGRAPLHLEHGDEDVVFSLITGEDEDSLRRGAAPTRQAICRGNCLIFIPHSRATRITATHASGHEVHSSVTAPPEGLRLRFNRPSRRALVASYVLYPVAASLAIGGALSLLLVPDPGVRVGSAIGLFSGAALTLALGVTTNVLAFDGMVQSHPPPDASTAAGR